MATVTVRPNGFGAGCAGPGTLDGSANPKRGRVIGWSVGAARRNTEFLQSVNVLQLAHVGIALTLTIGAYPSTSAEYHATRRAFLAFAARRGWTVQHWVIEATAAGRPHMHMALFGGQPTDLERWALVLGWLKRAQERGWECGVVAQTAEPITGVIGWLQYVSKHGSRGARHYQRSTPVTGWETTGRLWGRTSTWPTLEPVKYDLTDAEFHRFRRIALALGRSRLRARGASSTRAQRLGSPLRSPDPSASRRAGIGMWLDGDTTDAIVTLSLGRESPAYDFDY